MKLKTENNAAEKNENTEERGKRASKKHFSFNGRAKTIVLCGASFVVCILLVLCVLAARIQKYDKIFPNVIVEGINLGGLSKEEALQKLNTEYIPKLGEKEYKIVLADFTGKRIEPERSVSFKAEDIDAAADIELMVHSAYQHKRDKGFFGKMFAFYGAKNKPFICEMPSKVSSEKIDLMITSLAEGLETPVEELSYKLDGDVLTIISGHGGERVDRKTAENFIARGVFSLSDEEILLWIERAEPEKVDADKLYNEITNAKKDACYERVDGEIVISEDFPKVELDKNDLKKALATTEPEYKINVKTTPADVTAEELKAKLFRDNMGSWTSRFSASNVPRSSNVRLTASRINGVTLLPGEVFSYDKTIGSRTAANGYKVAGVYVGNKVEEGIGGGICQTSSTLYSAVLYSNLEIVSRTSHSLPVSYMPPGQDATIAEGYIDFKFRNNTDYPIKIVCNTTSSTVTCSIFGVKNAGEKVEIINTKTADNIPKTVREYDETVPVGYKKISQKGAAGYNYSSVRVVRLNGEEKKRENLTKSIYKATDTIEVVNPQDKDVLSENLTIYDPDTFGKTSTDTAPAANENALPEEENTIKPVEEGDEASSQLTASPEKESTDVNEDIVETIAVP